MGVIPLPAGATMLTFDDVTHSITIEESLRKSNLALEEAARIKSDFVKHVSYELRSPLTSIIGFAQLLDDAGTGALNDKQQTYLDYILSSTDSLMALVNSILDLATVEAGILALNLGKVDPASIIEDAKKGMEDRLVDNEIRIISDIDPGFSTITADETRLRQVLYNLMSNAVASSAKGGAVKVKLRQTDENLVLSVIDRGRGMPAGLVNAAFEPFETGAQGKQAGGNHGAGLGLTLAKRLVERHGGTIRLWSREGFGTVVRCTLPFAPALEDAAE